MGEKRVIAYAFWLLCAFVTDAIIARKARRRTGLMWGLLLGPVGLLIAALLPCEKDAEPQGTSANVPVDSALPINTGEAVVSQQAENICTSESAAQAGAAAAFSFALPLDLRERFSVRALAQNRKLEDLLQEAATFYLDNIDQKQSPSTMPENHKQSPSMPESKLLAEDYDDLDDGPRLSRFKWGG